MPAATAIMGDAPVKSLHKDFLRAAEDFSAMQQEHQTALLAGNYKDIFFWVQSRERAFRSLVRIFDVVVACARDNAECAVRAKEIMKKLLVDEDALQELILARRVEVQEQLLTMRKGKEALQGYNITKGLVPRPRYLSNRM